MFCYANRGGGYKKLANINNVNDLGAVQTLTMLMIGG